MDNTNILAQKTENSVTSPKFRDLGIEQSILHPMFRKQVELALPRHVSADRLIRTVMSEFRNNKSILKCNKESVLRCVIAASQLGLELGMLGNAYLIPFRDTCQLIIGYKGMIELARRSGQVMGIRAHVVDEADEFRFELGLIPSIHHKPAEQKTGKMRYVYAVAQLKDGGYHFEVMSRDEVEKIASKRPNNIWRDYFDEMAKKTAIRRLFKYLPVSSEMAIAVTLDERADAGVDIQIDTGVLDVDLETGEILEPQTKTRADEIASSLN